MKLAIFGDSHMGARNDSQAFLEYFGKFYNDILFPTILEQDIKQVIHLGDVFDRRKYINFHTLSYFQSNFFSFFKNNPDVHLDIILGNHDIYYRNSNSINSPSLLMNSEGLENIHIHEEPTTKTFDSLKIDLIPWINSENREKTLDYIRLSNSAFCCGHFELNNFEVFKNVKAHQGMDPSFLRNYELVLSGHFHMRQKKENSNVFYIGSPYEITFSDYDLPHGFFVLDTETRELEEVKNPYRMFTKIFYDDRKPACDYKKYDFSKHQDTYVKLIVEHKQSLYNYDQFIDNLYNSHPHNIVVEEIVTVDDTSEDEVDTTKDTLTILQEYVDDLTDVNIDKNTIKDKLNSLYLEALTLEE